MSGTPREGGDDLLESFDSGEDMGRYFDFEHPESPNRAAEEAGLQSEEDVNEMIRQMRAEKRDGR